MQVEFNWAGGGGGGEGNYVLHLSRLLQQTITKCPIDSAGVPRKYRVQNQQHPSHPKHASSRCACHDYTTGTIKCVPAFQFTNQFLLIRAPSSRKSITVPGSVSRLSSVPHSFRTRRSISHEPRTPALNNFPF